MMRIYLYAVGIVLVLGLVMPFDAIAGNSTLCINGVNVYGGGSCGTTNTVSNTRDRYVLQGREAMTVMMNMSSDRIAGIDSNGNMHMVGIYQGNQYPEVRLRVFSCQSSSDATKFYCNSWPAF